MNDLSAVADVAVPTADRIAHIRVPARMRHLPKDHRGYHVPRFVLWAEGDPSDAQNLRQPGHGKPYFQIMDVRHLSRCVRSHQCWICGNPLVKIMVFVIGPMCAINRVSAEPPSHLECARYAVQVCPFLAIPEMRRLPTHRFAGTMSQAGFALPRNPGVSGLWCTQRYRTFKPHAGGDGVLFEMGEPSRVEWFVRGREATRAEVLASSESGYPALEEAARQEHPDRAEEALAELVKQRDRMMRYLPAE